ncbi:MAG TPA: hypothetical protein PKI78_03355 [Anaerolineales bacterium]|nr:hypothetical protein [Anaerolineales bacterium]
MLYLHFIATVPTFQVVMVMPGNLIRQMPVPFMSGLNKSIRGKKFQSTVDRGFGQAWMLDIRKRIHLGRRKVPIRMMKHMQNG